MLGDYSDLEWLKLSTGNLHEPSRLRPFSQPSFTQVGPYDSLEELGRGGMGVVFRAFDRRLRRPVALKMLLAGAYADGAARSRLLTEAAVLARLTHPHIVRVFDIGEQEGVPYFAMELVEGEQLSGYLARMGALPVREAARIAESIARAVHHAHQQGVIHRDLKPANILMQPAAEGPSVPRVADFGIARLMEQDQHLTQSGHLVGTPAYMAPEVLAGKTSAAPQPTIDIYALGVMLYEMLTGRPPFHGSGLSDLLLQASFHEPIPPSRRRADLPRDLENIVLKCLEREPTHRYASAAELADDLRRFQEGRAVLARPLGPLARLGRWMKRNPTIAILLGLLLAAVMGIVVALAVGLRLAQLERDKAVAARSEAEQRQAQTRRALDLMTSTLFDDLLGKQPEFHTGHRDFLEKAHAEYVELAAHSPDLPSTAAAFARLGTIERRLGRLAAAEHSYREAVALYDRLATSNEPDLDWQRAAVHGNLGTLLADRGQYDEALKHCNQAIELIEQQDAQVELSPRRKQSLGVMLANRGRILSGRVPQAMDDLARARAIQEALLQADPKKPDYRFELASTRLAQGALALHARKHTAAAEHLRAGIALLTARAGDADRPDIADQLAAARANLGTLLNEQGRPADALQELSTAVTLAEQLVKEYPVMVRYHLRLANCLAAKAGAIQHRQRSEALELLNRSARLVEGVPDDWADDRSYRQTICLIYPARAFLLGALRRFDEALADCDRAALFTPAGSQRESLEALRLMLLIESNRHEQAIARGQHLVTSTDLSPEACHDLARLLAIGRLRPTTPEALHSGYNQAALGLIRRAAEGGYYRSAAQQKARDGDKAFAALRKLPEWKALFESGAGNDLSKEP
jgi:tetratricopeptide (TPR) repeat protein